jgi:hypothetical protein
MCIWDTQIGNLQFWIDKDVCPVLPLPKPMKALAAKITLLSCPTVDNWKKNETHITFCHMMEVAKILTKPINITVLEYGITNVRQFFVELYQSIPFYNS